MRRGVALVPATLLGASTLLGALIVASCEQVLGVPDRKTEPHVVCASSVCTCTDGFADCDKNLANGCEEALDDPDNCEACGHSCLGGQCGDSGCEPATTEIDPTKIYVYGPAVDDDGEIYFVDGVSGTIYAEATTADHFDVVGKVASPESAVVAAVQSGAGAAWFGVAQASGEFDLYKLDTTGATLVSTIQGMAIVDFAVTTDGVFLVAREDGVTALDLYFAALGSPDASLVEDDIEGGTPSDDKVYWLSEGGDVRTYTDGAAETVDSEPSDLFEQVPSANSVAVSDGAYYFTTDDFLERIDRTTGDETRLMDYAADATTRGDTVYIIDESNQTVEAWDGVNTTVIASGIHVTLDARIQATDKALYWADESAVSRLAF